MSNEFTSKDLGVFDRAVYRVLIEQARDLLDGTPDGERDLANPDGSPEYVRAMVELIVRSCGLSHDVHTDLVRRDIQYGLSPRRENADLLRRTLPMLERLGDFIGNGPINPGRADSLGERCDLILDIKRKLGEVETVPVREARPCDCLGAPKGHLAGATPACSANPVAYPLTWTAEDVEAGNCTVEHPCPTRWQYGPGYCEHTS